MFFRLSARASQRIAVALILPSLACGKGAGGNGKARFVRPNGYATVVLRVDDTANRTYGSGQIYWKGGWKYDSKTNVATIDTTWGGVADGQLAGWPQLYDDGPISESGHEAEGQKAGDHVHSAAVFIKGDAKPLEYGMCDELGNWIWPKKNGTVQIALGSEETLDLGTLTIAAFGTAQALFALDLKHLDPALVCPAENPACDTAVEGEKLGFTSAFIKGTMTNWKSVQMNCNSDLYCVYDHTNARKVHGGFGKHDGLLAAKQEVQFVFLLNDTTEYKVPTDCSVVGVAVATDVATPGVFAGEKIDLREESRSPTKNTAITVGTGGGASVTWTGGDSDGGIATDGGDTSTDGGNVTDGGIDSNDAGIDNSDGGLAIQLVNPAAGPPGTTVKLTGLGFSAGATVLFGAKSATISSIAAPHTINVTAPNQGGAGFRGKVDVTVTVGGISTTYPQSFQYQPANGAPAISALVDATTGGWFGPVAGGDVTVTGSGLSGAVGVTVDGQNVPATSASDGSFHFTAPAHAVGMVDMAFNFGAGGIVTQKGGWEYVLRAARVPAVDGNIDVSSGNDWSPYAQIASAPNGHSLGWGASNHLETLYAAYSTDTLYLGIVGGSESTNAIVALLSIGGTSGISDFTKATATDGALVKHIAGSAIMTSGGWSFQSAVGTVGGATSENAFVDGAGIRSLTTLTNFPWLNGSYLRTSAGAVEMAIHLACLYNAPPSDGNCLTDNSFVLGGQALSVAVVLTGDATGCSGCHADQVLPTQPAYQAGSDKTKSVLSNVVSLKLR